MNPKNVFFFSNGDRAHVSSESVNHGITKKNTNNLLLTYFGGYHSTERRALVVHKTSVVPPHAALLFCKGKIEALYMSDDVSRKQYYKYLYIYEIVLKILCTFMVFVIIMY